MSEDLRMFEPHWKMVWDTHFVNDGTEIEYIDNYVLRRRERERWSNYFRCE